MRAPRVTLMDVAQRAGVSRTTASFVLTGRRDMRISAEAQERVLRAARELNYHPNLLARSLRTNLSQTVGMISDVIASEPFAGQFVRSAVATALRHQHLLFVGETEGDPEVERQLLQAMLDRGVSGFVYATMDSREVTVPRALRGHPLVLLNCLARDEAIPAVLPDEEAAGRQAVTTLLDAGHSDRITLVGETPEFVLAGRWRERGISAALAEHGLRLAARVPTLWWPEPAMVAVADYLGAAAPPSALICMNDRVAMGAYQALAKAGLRVPEDVSVVAFDNSDLAGWLDPGLTSLGIPHIEMASRAVELLVAGQIGASGAEAGTSAPPVRVNMPLHERGSIAAPARRRRSTPIRTRSSAARA